MPLHVLAATPPLQPIPTSNVGGSIAVGIVAILHILIATFITGASFLVCVSEGISIARNDARHERLARGLLRSMAYVFTFGAALAIFWVLFILLGMWGIFFIALTRITFWPFIFEAALFLTEIVLLYTLYANWERLAAYRRARFGMAVLLAVALWWQQFFIDVVASYMLTPNGGDTNQLSQILNPTDLPLTIHRTVGNIAWAGAIVAAVAGFRYMRAKRRGPDVRVDDVPSLRSVGAMSATWYSQADGAATARVAATSQVAFFDWAGTWGAVWAIALTMFQPWIGYSYAKEIQLHAYPAWYRMMFGDISNVFLLQITLLGVIFLLGTSYFWRRMRASGTRGIRTQVAMLTVLVPATLLAATPARFAWTQSDISAAANTPWWDGGLLNPIGTMIPNKIIALLAMMICGLVSVTGVVRAHSNGELRWGDATRRSQWLLVSLGVTVSVMMAVMGVIREHSRQPYLIEGEMTIQGQQIVNTPNTPAPSTPTTTSP
ncbi:MAG TPA: cytochrome ubiquinol oxidase subunit I [Candidatus Angelobacter sp.]|jgi:cytochrome d ubiquinol oxidase subunit I|nr:cytochrome ubiquinol oxidase subunit I [Candidatus Angelobacter sp.]